MISKRDFLTGSAALAALPGTALAEDLNLSIFTDLGPFYPVRKPAEVDADLTRLAGHKSRAKGKVIEVTGRVLNLRGEPAKGAKLEVWQANAAGKYDHPGDTSDLPLDPDFQGYASFVAGADGRYSFLTIEPADYPAATFIRAAHIHFDVMGSGSRLVTQLYLPNTETRLAGDPIFQKDLAPYPPEAKSRVFGKRRAGASKAEAGADVYDYDIVLISG